MKQHTKLVRMSSWAYFIYDKHGQVTHSGTEATRRDAIASAANMRAAIRKERKIKTNPKQIELPICKT